MLVRDQVREVEIVEFTEKYHDDLKRLSYEWLEKYDLLEPEDVRILDHPQEVILDAGGRIFFAKYGAEIVGTVSLIPVDADTFELAKLAVAGEYQGMQIGSRLMEVCLQVAKEAGAKKVILYTNHQLTSAQRLYEKFGFQKGVHVDSKYIESDIFMTRSL